ncbi:hypothetical protein GCM10008985_00850 [Halococcus dombrowskii]|uniref:Uncharacterized protein n=1 Tax=Halococcus dombrowskii TaxID=179637 RepID=A0AAV3SCE0_HALDO
MVFTDYSTLDLNEQDLIRTPTHGTQYSPETKICKNRKEIPDGYRKNGFESFWSFYDRLRLYNTGRFNGIWRDESHELEIDNRNLIKSLSSQLPMIDRERLRAERWFMSLDKRRYTSIGGIETVAFSVCAIVCNEDDTRYYPTAKNNNQRFEKVADSLDFDKYDLQRVIERVRAELGLV